METLTRANFIVSLILLEVMCSLAVRAHLRTIPFRLRFSFSNSCIVHIERPYGINMYSFVFATGNFLMFIFMAQNIYVKKRDLGLGDCTYDRRCIADFLTGNRSPLLCLHLFRSVSSGHICWVEAWSDRRARIRDIRTGAQFVRQSKFCQRFIWTEFDRYSSLRTAHSCSMRSARVVQELLCAVRIDRSSLSNAHKRLRWW
jgi:hypothetical protein